MTLSESRGDFYSRTEQLINETVGNQEIEKSLKRRLWSGFRVAMRISEQALSTYAGQIMLLSTVNLVGRFCDNIYFPDSLRGIRCIVPFFIGEDIDLLQRCIEVFNSINPLASADTGSAEPAEAISIGVSSDADIVMGSHNWISYVSPNARNAPLTDSRNPFGPLFASCLASAEAFRRLLKVISGRGTSTRDRTQHLSFSVLEGQPVTQQSHNPDLSHGVNIGNILLAGCGAVGNGIASALALMDHLQGSVTLLDDEDLEQSNVSRYATTKLNDVGNPKVDILAEILRTDTVSASPLVASIESLTDSTVSDFDLILSALDNRNNHQSRIYLQNLLPQRIIHAATQGLAVAVANIDFIHGACLGCLFYPRKEQLTLVQDPDCGGVVVRTKEGNEHAAAVSFVSAASGILAAAEVIKLSIHELGPLSLNNYLNMSLLSPELADVRFLEKDSHCVCLCGQPFKQNAYNKRYSIKKGQA